MKTKHDAVVWFFSFLFFSFFFFFFFLLCGYFLFKKQTHCSYWNFIFYLKKTKKKKKPLFEDVFFKEIENGPNLFASSTCMCVLSSPISSRADSVEFSDSL